MRFHFSFHKCLTKFSGLCFNRALNNLKFKKNGYAHFNSEVDLFLESAPRLKMASINNHFFDPVFLDSISGGEASISLFLRDPRDLLVSGYHYHKGGREEWTRVEGPSPDDYKVVNGAIPCELQGGGISLHRALNNSDFETGMMLELQFRQNHFESMEKWLAIAETNIFIADYEDIVGNEGELFSQLGSFHRLSYIERKGLAFFADRYKASRNERNHHIRDPRPGQWRGKIPSSILNELDKRHPNLISLYETTRARSA